MPPTVDQLAADLAQGRTTSRQLTDAALARAQNPAGEGARTFTLIDADRARAMAQASDALRAAGVVRWLPNARASTAVFKLQRA